MHVKRLLAGVASAALLSALPVAIATPAATADSSGDSFTVERAEATTVATRIAYTRPLLGVYRYKQWMEIQGQVQGELADGSWGYLDESVGGTITLYRQVAPATTWRKVSTKELGDGTFSWITPSYGNTVYRLEYSGSTQGEFTFEPVTRDRTVKGSRAPHDKGVESATGRLYIKGNVDPGWAYKSIKLIRRTSSGGTWKTYKWVKTNRYGAYSAQVAAPDTTSGRYAYRVVIPASSPTFSEGRGATWYATTVRR